jgi:hypothetical protein
VPEERAEGIFSNYDDYLRDVKGDRYSMGEENN